MVRAGSLQKFPQHPHLGGARKAIRREPFEKFRNLVGSPGGVLGRQNRILATNQRKATLCSPVGQSWQDICERHAPTLIGAGNWPQRAGARHKSPARAGTALPCLDNSGERILGCDGRAMGAAEVARREGPNGGGERLA